MSAQSVKHSRPIIGIVLILIALTTINFLAYSLMNGPNLQLLQKNESSISEKIIAPISEIVHSEDE